MIRRLANPNNLAARVAESDVEDVDDFDPIAWFDDPHQYALTNGPDLLLAKEWADGVVEIHWLLRSRGRRAIHAGVDFLRHLYNKENARIVVGTVPAHRRAARWFSRQVGGKSNGIVQTEWGDAELFTLSREDFEAQHGFSKV